MLLFLRDDSSKCIGRLFVHSFERLQLLAHMAKHDAFDRYRRGSDGVAPGQPGQCAQREAANCTPEVASAARFVAALEFRSE